jgi:mRNA interferase MazF
MVDSASPAPGQIVWLDFSPTAGTEQAGRRPALVVSDAGYNARSGRAVVAPITSRVRGWAFEVRLPEGFELRGVVLADQLRTVDWRARAARLGSVAPLAVLEETRAKVAALLGLA